MTCGGAVLPHESSREEEVEGLGIQVVDLIRWGHGWGQEFEGSLAGHGALKGTVGGAAFGVTEASVVLIEK